MSEPLDPDLVRRGLVMWGEVANVMLDHRLERWRRLNMTTMQLRLIGVLQREGGNLAASALAHRLHVSPPVLTRVADRLVKRGFIQREPDPRDRRIVLLVLKPEGRSIYQDATSWAQSFLNTVFEAMGEQDLVQFVESGESFIHAAERVRNDSS